MSAPAPSSLPTFPNISTFTHSSSSSADEFPVHNPANGAILTTVQGGNATTVKAAIASAKAAFPRWRALPPTARGALLLECASVLESRASELATLLCLENGKPYQDALNFDCRFLPAIFRYFGSLVDKLPNQFYDRGPFYATVVREPHGVVAGILPFNWPPIHTGGKTAPALAAGNVIILKPGEQAPFTCLKIVELLNTVLPEGVVQAVPAAGIEVPQALLKDPDVKMISFTGSTAAGKAVSQAVAEAMKPLQLELGGKNALVVFDDADLRKAMAAAIDGGFFNKGEACTATSRVLVQSAVYEEFVGKMAKAVQKLRAGSGLDEKTHVGPVVSKVQQQKVLGWIEKAQEDGARLVAQGQVTDDPSCKEGYFVRPTLLADVTRNMAIAQEEVFGPVLTVTKFETEDEAVDIVNESRYGLTGAVFTKDNERALRVARRMETGLLFVNNYVRNILGLPFGGVKDSGHGREHCLETFNEWSTAKVIQIPSGMGEPPKTWRGAEEVLVDIFRE